MSRVIALGGAALLLSACDDVPQTWSRAEIEGIAYNAAEDVSDASAPDTSELESRIAELETTVRDQEREIDALESDIDAAQAHIDNLYDN